MAGSATHYIPVGLEAMVTPTPLLDIGVRLAIDGQVGVTGTSSTAFPYGYFDQRAVTAWFRVRI